MLVGCRSPTMVLAMAPAGIAEMVLTGKLLGLDATVITGFQHGPHPHGADLVPPMPAGCSSGWSARWT